MAASVCLLVAILFAGCTQRTVEIEVMLSNTTSDSKSGRVWLEAKDNKTVYGHDFQDLAGSQRGGFNDFVDSDSPGGPPPIRLREGTYQAHALAGNVSGTSSLELRSTGGALVVAIQNHTVSFMLLPGPDG